MQAGSQWDRFDFSWARLEPEENTWDFLPYDALVNDLHNGGVQNIVGILQMTPDWAATQCFTDENGSTLQQSGDGYPPFFAPAQDEGAYTIASQAAWDDGLARTPPSGLYRPWTVGDFNDNHWAKFVYTVVSHYKQQVKSWEMWNEVEWDLLWCGNEQDYAQLLKVGYQAAKAACPDCTVLYAGLHYWADKTYFERVLDILNDDPAAPANNDFFDAMSLHLYSRSAQAYDLVNHIRDRMKVYVADHPIWITEAGVPVWGDPQAYNDKYEYAATQEEAAAYLIQSYANALAAGVDRYLFFRTNDADMGEYFGLIRNDRSVRPPMAYQVAATYLISTTACVPTDQPARHAVGRAAQQVSVLWNTGPVYTPATIANDAGESRGATQTLTATTGAYTITLPEQARICSPAGRLHHRRRSADVIESETVNQPPISTVRALPNSVHVIVHLAWGRDNEAGIWFYDVQVRVGEGGVGAVEVHDDGHLAVFTGADGSDYAFRARATDRVGNREAMADCA